jgi:hypothetical protein
VKDENGDLLADSDNTVSSWENYFCQILNVHGVYGVTVTEMHTAESLVPETSSFETEIATKKFKSQCTDQIPAEVIQTGGHTLRSEIYETYSIWNKIFIKRDDKRVK